MSHHTCMVGSTVTFQHPLVGHITFIEIVNRIELFLDFLHQRKKIPKSIWVISGTRCCSLGHQTCSSMQKFPKNIDKKKLLFCLELDAPRRIFSSSPDFIVVPLLPYVIEIAFSRDF